jgi:hypothetical protein
MDVPTTINCVECGGTCHLLSHVPDGGFEPGDWVAYRCGDCLDRFDLQMVDPGDDEADDGTWVD